MAITECGKGHVYDNEQYSACPYCNQGTEVINFGGDAPNRTVAPGMTAPTVAPIADMGPTFAQNEPSKTVAPGMERRKIENENKTVGVFKKEHDIDPVVGWLVCLEGPEKGKDYRLWARINSIGRSEKMDVCIRKDLTISKENHARLAYDPKHNNYNLIPADSTNNIYLNDEPVYTPIKINAYDVIELGTSKMVFVPLCSERFNWEDGVTPAE